MEERICCIFGAGDLAGEVPVLREDDFVIAADGGLAYLRAHALRADLILGDFDSLGAPPEGENVVRLPVVKDVTDVAAAIAEGRRRGFSLFHIYGGTGGRIDHTVANIQLLHALAAEGAQGVLFSPSQALTVLRGGAEAAFDETCRGTVSLFSLTPECRGVTIEGLFYPLADATLSVTVPLGVSNSFTGRPARVALREGAALLVLPRACLPHVRFSFGGNN
ncbi:MAG: thiamine diphosphokinase [Oscillibacter sp.]|nr:thiamine diphosphokinase [Oscillibacter sp.]